MLQEFHKDLYLGFIFDGDLVSKLEGLNDHLFCSGTICDV